MISEKQSMMLVAEVLGVDPEHIGPETRADDVEAWDSMGTMAIVLWLHDDFAIELEPHQTAELQSIPKILQLLRQAGHLY